jgi:hypothetical protein
MIGISMPQVEGPAIRHFFNGLPEGPRQAVCDRLAHCIRCRRKLGAFATAWAVRGRQRYANSRSFTRIKAVDNL